VNFVRSSNNWMHPRSENASTNTLGGRTVSAVRDEQGNSVTFASRDNHVMGGGLVHVVNAVSPGGNLGKQSRQIQSERFLCSR
jgi:hypothetical protein